MSVFHMHVDDGEQDHASVYVLKPETDCLKPQISELTTSRFTGSFRAGGAVGDGNHAGVKACGILRWTVRE